MIEADRIYEGNWFRGIMNDHIFKILKIGRETSKAANVPDSKTVYVTARDMSNGKISQTNYDTFIRLQLVED